MEQYRDLQQEQLVHDTIVKLSSLLTTDELKTLNSIERPSSVIDLNNLFINKMVSILCERKSTKFIKCLD